MRKAFLVFLMLAASAPALANDSTAELATGGLKFRTSPDIQMRSEELFLSMSEVRVRYRFFNTSNTDKTTLVAFPMPDITASGPDENIAIPSEDPENFLDFHTTANGRPVETRVEQKVLGHGVDRTDLIRKLGVPLQPFRANEALDKLPTKQWDHLVKLGLAEVQEYDVGKGMEKHLEARWTLRTTYYWQQTFPARAELVIEHVYKPSVGETVETPLGQEWAKKEDFYKKYIDNYCPDDTFMAVVERNQKAAAQAQRIAYVERRIEYVLKTGANWSGPIQDFRLVVDKGEANSLMSFCGEGVKKISPTQFEMHKTDFTPDADLHILFLTKPQT